MADWLSQAIPVDQQQGAAVPPWMAGAVPLSSAGAPDKYQQAALDEQAQSRKLGLDDGTGFKNMILHGATMGASNDILAALDTPVQMLAHGTLDPSEAWKYALARQEVAHDTSKQETGVPGAIAEGLAGVGTGTGLANKGLTFVKDGQGLLGRALGTAADGGVYGGVNGFFDSGNSLGGAAQGAAAGAALGGAIPLVTAAGGAALAPLTSNIRARLNPGGVAESQLARALDESGQTPQQIAKALDDAAAAGQPMFTMADALGNPGQRMLSAVSRAPGAGRTEAVNFLENRQAGQSRRVASQLADALDASDTAAQRTASLTADRSATADANYGAARADAGAVNVTPAIQKADETLTPGAMSIMNPGSGIADNSVEAAVRRAKGYLTNGQEQISNFDQVLSAKREIDNMIESATPTQQRVLIPIKAQLDDALATSSPGYAAARDTFRQQSQAIDAIGQGRAAAMRGRAEDTIPAFNDLAPDAQSAFRAGYADPLIESASNAAPGVNKVRPLLADGPKDELQAFSLYNGPYQPGGVDQLQQQLARENTMFETRNHALGNSRTADNLADQNALHVDPSVLANLLHGNFAAAGSHALRNAANGLTGNTPAVREELARLLLSRGGQDAGVTLSRVQDEAMRRQALAAALMQGGAVAGGNLSGGYLAAK